MTGMRALFSLLTLLCLSQTTLIHACLPEDSSTGNFHVGTDGPADPATLGYTMNHFALNVNNFTSTFHFYNTILGMRHVFTFDMTPNYSITYLGYSHGGKNGTGFQTGAELLAEKSNIEGLVELIYFSDTAEKLEPSTTTSNTFSHVGLIVPDVTKIQERMDEFGVEITKRVGEMPKPGGAVARAFGLSRASTEEQAAALEGIAQLGFQNVLIVVDPDGNLVEIQQKS